MSRMGLPAVILMLATTWTAASVQEAATNEEAVEAEEVQGEDLDAEEEAEETRKADPTLSRDEKLEITAFVAKVSNRFAARGRRDLINAEDDSANEEAVGFEFIYSLHEWKNGVEVEVKGSAIHSARILETPCSADPNVAGTPTPGQCKPKNDPSALDPNDFFEILQDGETLEWLLEADVTFLTFNGGHTGAYAAARAGFIRTEDAGDDVIDNHFYGLGITHLKGDYDGSYLEVGRGKTDFFAPGQRSDRWKLAAGLNYTPPLKRTPADVSAGKEPEHGPVTIFVEGWLDSDLGPGSDDIQIFYGLTFDVRRILGRLLGPGGES